MAGEAGRRFRVYISTTGGTTSASHLRDPNKYITDVDFSYSGKDIDVTGIGDSNYTYAADLPEVSLSLTGNDYSTTLSTTSYAEAGPYELLMYDGSNNLNGTTRYIEISMGAGTTTGLRKISGYFTIMGYSVTAAVAGKRGFKADLKPSGNLTFGAY